MIKNESALFSNENIQKICELKNAVYVCDTTLANGADCAVFYGDTAHPDSGSRYFGLYYHPMNNQLYICNAADIENQEITAVIADNGDIIYSRHRHDYRVSDDKSVWIDGGRSYVRSGLYDKSKFTTLIVKEGKLIQMENTENEISNS